MIVKGGEHMFKRFMKKEKGFTLVELLAVIVILGIILAIAIPAIGNVIDKSENQAHEANKALIENAARLADVAGDFQDGMTVTELEQAGYLEEVPTNPKTKAPYSGKVTKTGKKFVYSDTE
jgi:type IV pilus assembly protein PilA